MKKETLTVPFFFLIEEKSAIPRNSTKIKPAKIDRNLVD
jgi:hypothetical protein